MAIVVVATGGSRTDATAELSNTTGYLFRCKFSYNCFCFCFRPTSTPIAIKLLAMRIGNLIARMIEK